MQYETESVVMCVACVFFFVNLMCHVDKVLERDRTYTRNSLLDAIYICVNTKIHYRQMNTLHILYMYKINLDIYTYIINGGSVYCLVWEKNMQIYTQKLISVKCDSLIGQFNVVYLVLSNCTWNLSKIYRN